MNLFLFINKSAPDVTDFVLLLIGILLGLLGIDWSFRFIKRKVAERKEKIITSEDEFFQKELKETPSDTKQD